MPHLPADRVHVDVASLRLHHEHTGMALGQSQRARAALAASQVRAEERGGERARRELLAAPFRPGQEVRVVWARRGLAQEGHRLVLPRDPLQHRTHGAHRSPWGA